ncbi:MAG: endo-1,4-beta-xylanase [Fibrobacteria bacterium]
MNRCFSLALVLSGWAAGALWSQESLRALAATRQVYIGAAVGAAFWGGDSRYQETLRTEFNLLVAENAMKFQSLEPKRNEFTWTQADELAAFASQNGMAMRGHTLVWHQQSGWIATAGLSRTEMLAALENHISKVMGRYRGKIVEWDVVNEAIDDTTGGLRESFWQKTIGDDYLDSAFTYAHRADPGALLFYNDYSGEGMGGKSDKIYALVKGMMDRKIPIHGVGLQCHFVNAGWNMSKDIDANMKRLASLGLRVSVTELDFRITLPADSAKLAKQKSNYETLLGICLANPNCKTFLTWGFSDAFSWVPAFFPGMGAALIFDAQYGMKPAYHGLQSAFALVSGLSPLPPLSPRLEKGRRASRGPSPLPQSVRNHVRNLWPVAVFAEPGDGNACDARGRGLRTSGRASMPSAGF